jgi:hypothetical protein
MYVPVKSDGVCAHKRIGATNTDTRIAALTTHWVMFALFLPLLIPRFMAASFSLT